MTVKKVRLDILLNQKGFFESREKARSAVMAGCVRVNGQPAGKPGTAVDPDASIQIISAMPYVSRGGFKLEKALKSFAIDLSGLVVLDVGASTGGFTDCALQHGALKVIAVDVGYGQLAWKIRSDPRVEVHERTNIRYLKPEALGCRPDFVTIDVSFISLEKVLPAVAQLISEKAGGVALIKPQFEAGRDKVGKKGVVRDPLVHKEVIRKICKMIGENRWGVRGLDFSPVKGPEGNIEYLLYIDFSGPCPFNEDLIDNMVDSAHKSF
ncbi:MAG: TlyA family RNA methyltransferase [Bacillota bacterium]